MIILYYMLYYIICYIILYVILYDCVCNYSDRNALGSTIIKKRV